MKYLIIASIATFASMVLATGCVSKSVEVIAPPVIGPDCDSNYIYSSGIHQVLQEKCATEKCHVKGGGGPGDFTNYLEVKEKVNSGKLEQYIFDFDLMPPQGSGLEKLTECEKLKLRKWINDGAPN